MKKYEQLLSTKTRLQCSKKLFTAAHGGDYEAAKKLLTEGANANSVDIDNGKISVMHVACRKGDLNMVKLLRSYKSDLDRNDKDNLSPLFYAIDSANIELIGYLIDEGANIEHQDVQDRTPFYYSSHKSSTEAMKLLVSKGANINIKSKLGRTALSKSCWNGNVEVLGLLLSTTNPDINERDSKGRTPLHNAVWGCEGGREGKKMSLNGRDSPECAELLLKAGAKIDIPDVKGNQPVHVAASSKAPDSLSLLLKYKADVNALNSNITTPFHKACKRGYAQCIKILVENGCKIIVEDNEKYNPLDYLFKYDQAECLKQIRGINSAVDSYLNTHREMLLEIAVKCCSINCIKELIEKNDINLHSAWFTCCIWKSRKALEFINNHKQMVHSMETLAAYIATTQTDEPITSICKLSIVHRISREKYTR